MEDSRKEIITRAGSAYGVPAQCNVQAYILRIGLVWPLGFSSGLFCPLSSTTTLPTRNCWILFRKTKSRNPPMASADNPTTPWVEIAPLPPKTPAKTKTARERMVAKIKGKREEGSTLTSTVLQSAILPATWDDPPSISRPARSTRHPRAPSRPTGVHKTGAASSTNYHSPIQPMASLAEARPQPKNKPEQAHSPPNHSHERAPSHALHAKTYRFAPCFS